MNGSHCECFLFCEFREKNSNVSIWIFFSFFLDFNENSFHILKLMYLDPSLKLIDIDIM